MGSRTSLKTSHRGGGGCNPLNPPPGSASATTSFSENVVMAETSYEMLEILSFCDRERAQPPSISLLIFW